MTDPTRPVLFGRRVLIVEDRYLIATTLAEEVRRLGGQVLGPAASVSDANELIEGQPVDLALLDVNLDGEMVFPIADELAARGVPFIFLTGYDGEVLPNAWRARPRLVKPLDLQVLGMELARIAPAPPG